MQVHLSRNQFQRWTTGLLMMGAFVILAVSGAHAQPIQAATSPNGTATTATCSEAISGTLTAMAQYNLITLDDFATSSEVEGRTFVGGNIVSGESANFAIHMTTETSDPTLVVVGNIASGNPLNLNAGSLVLKGELNKRKVNYNGKGSLVADKTLSDTVLTSQLETASTALSQVKPNNTATIPSPSGQPGALKFTVSTVDANGLATFNVAGAAVFNNSKVQQIELSPGSAKTILINVSGTSINWSDGNKVSQFTDKTWRSRVIWNFYEATSINLNSHNFMGALLAPYAAVKTQANIDGSTAVKSLDTKSEIHQPEFAGNLSDICPAPATPTATSTPTNTPVPPTATNTPTSTPTNTPVPPTATNTPTSTPTNTPVPPTATDVPTSTPTNTPVPPTATNTPTSTPTNTPVPPTATNTPTSTPTNTPVPPTATDIPTSTPTNTPVPPTATDVPTSTPVPPTATNTPTSTPTNTPVPPTATNTPTSTPTNTPVPPTATDVPTSTPTNTPVPPTATDVPTSTSTNTPVPPTATDVPTSTPTNTPVPPTATDVPTSTPTNTPVPPTATDVPTSTSTNTPVPPTATDVPTSTPINTPVPPTATDVPTSTPINTPVPPIATDGPGGSPINIPTSTPINTPVPPIATDVPTSTPINTPVPTDLPMPLPPVIESPVTHMVLTKVGTGSAPGGFIGADELVTYTLVVANQGDTPVTGLVVRDPLGKNMIYVRGNPAPSQTSDGLEWTLGTLPAGGEQTIILVVKVSAEDTTMIHNTAYLLGPVTLTNPGQLITYSVGSATTPFGPTAITLLAFNAESTSGGVNITWQTGTEFNTLGFALYRSTTALRTEAVLVTPNLVLSTSTNNSGASYQFNDSSAVTGQTYYYWLAETETTGAIHEYGPVVTSNTPAQSGFQLFAPFITR